MNQENIGKFISKERKNKNLTQKELADNLGISEKTISKWECGKGLPEVSLMQPLCKELDISVNELLNGAKDKKEDEVIIEYINYEKKKSKKKIILLTVVSLLLITFILSTIVYFFGNYGKNVTYELYGASDNFEYSYGLLIKSPQINLLNIGKISIINEKIEENQLKKISLMYKDEIIYSYSGGDLLSTNGVLLQEKNGYNEIFTEEKLKNVDDWELIIEYEIDEEIKTETINIQNKQIFKNDKFISLTTNKISANKNNKKEVLRRQEKEINEMSDILTKEGFETSDNRFYIKEINKNEYIECDVVTKKIKYRYEEDKENFVELSNYISSPDTVIQNDSISAYGKLEGKNYNYTYDIEGEKIKGLEEFVDEEEAWIYAMNFQKHYKELQALMYS